jgi:hypothetical protein
MTSDSASLALDFANSLVRGRFADAHGLLSDQLQTLMSVGELQETYQSMVSYFPSAPDQIEVMGENSAWPSQEAGDVAWVYISIASSTGYGEAVSVVIADDGDRNVIRSIEWGRP